MNNSTDNEYYLIRGYGRDFETGITSDDYQVLMGLLCPHVVAYFFSSDGALAEIQQREWSTPAPRMGADGPYRIYDQEFQDRLCEQILNWQSEIGFTASVIRVRPFFDDEHWVGIEALPEYLQEIDESDDDYAFLSTEREKWKDEGNFVFYWAKDYYMTGDGKVSST